MNARTRSAVARLGERPRRTSPTNFRSPTARSPNSDADSRVLRRNAVTRRSNSFVRFSIARKPEHGIGNVRKMVGNSLFPTSLKDNEIRNRGFGTPPPAGRRTPPFALWPGSQVGQGTYPLRCAGIRVEGNRVGYSLRVYPHFEGPRMPAPGTSYCAGGGSWVISHLWDEERRTPTNWTRCAGGC